MITIEEFKGYCKELQEELRNFVNVGQEQIVFAPEENEEVKAKLIETIIRFTINSYGGLSDGNDSDKERYTTVYKCCESILSISTYIWYITEQIGNPARDRKLDDEQLMKILNEKTIKLKETYAYTLGSVMGTLIYFEGPRRSHIDN